MSTVPTRFVFWQPMPSMHQVPFLEALATASKAEVVAAYADRLVAERSALGWRSARSSSVREVFHDDRAWSRLMADDAPTTLHVFSGFRCHPAVRSALARVASGRAPVGVISEAHDGHGLRGLARRARSVCDARAFSRRMSFILAMGQLGVSWFRAAGFSPDRIHPFAYVTPDPAATPARSDGGFRAIYVGQLIDRKGVDLLLDAISRRQLSAIALTIVGIGNAEASLRAQAARLDLSHMVSWQGVLPNEEIPALVACHDLLVLPSRFDGWGAVVNEALSVGTPVLCSSACGATELLAGPYCGGTFRSGDASALAATLSKIHAEGPVAEDRRQRIVRHARSFSAASVARYFLDVVASSMQALQPPLPPWRTDTVIPNG
jgi:glycosyltransferase involved in cell wall biosynthesis